MNIREFARTIGVSPTTVSNAISGQGRISEATRRMVLERMQDLDFIPNLNAQRLSQGRTHLVALDFLFWHDYLADLFFAELTREIQDVLEARKYGLLLSGPGEVLDRWVKTRAVDGVILGGDLSDLTIPERIAQAGTPCVVIGHSPITGIRDVGSVVIDLSRGAREVARRLMEQGHRRIGYISGGVPDAVWFEFRDALREGGILLQDSLTVRAVSADRESAGTFRIGATARDGAEAFRKLMAQAEPPTAVFVRTDMLAIGALQAAYQMGVRVPEDLSLVGHDDVPFAALAVPPLTTVRVDCMTLARLAVDMLLSLLNAPNAPVKPQVVQTELVLRDTLKGAPFVDSGGSYTDAPLLHAIARR